MHPVKQMWTCGIKIILTQFSFLCFVYLLHFYKRGGAVVVLLNSIIIDGRYQ